MQGTKKKIEATADLTPEIMASKTRTARSEWRLLFRGGGGGVIG